MSLDMTATFQAAELGRARFTGSLTAFALACAVGWQPFGQLFFVVGVQLRHGIVCVAPSGLNCVGGSYLGLHSLRSFHPRLFCVTASRFGLGREF